MPTELHLASGSPATAEGDAVVIGLLAAAGDGSAPRLAPGSDDVAAAFDGDSDSDSDSDTEDGNGATRSGLLGLLTVAGATGKADEVVKIPTRGALAAPLLVAVGLGRPDDDGASTAEQVRRASGAAGRALAGTARAVSTLARLDLAAAAEGTLLGAYAFTAYRSNGDARPPVGRVDLCSDDGDADAVLRRAAATATAVRTARDLVNTPPNDLFPESFAARARELAEAAGVEVEVLDEAALREGGFGGVVGVGSGSSRGPRLVRLTYSGGETPRAKVALVGKGITFDTGGISIKPAANMDHMTSDMSGAAAVIATTVLAAQLELPVAVTATVPMAENMPSDTAYRPGDVLHMYGGRTVEVLNTDAEGRLILADAIVRAAEDQPDYLVETSTLTGAQQVALGLRTAGIMGSAELRDRVARHAVATGEDGWAMPLPEHMRAELDSRVADLANVTGAAVGRDARGRHVPARVRAGRPAVGAHRHRRPGVPLRGPVRLHGQGRHRRPGPDPDRPPDRHRRERLTPREVESEVALAPVALAQDLLSGVVVAHALRVADELDVVDRDLELAGELARAVRTADPAPGPLAVLGDEQHRRVRHGGARLHERLHPVVRGGPLAQVRLVLADGRAQRAGTPSAQPVQETHDPHLRPLNARGARLSPDPSGPAPGPRG